MRVLVLESEWHAADAAASQLEAAGHEVRRCHDHGQNSYPCNGLRAGEGCPMEGGVDVALVLRAHPLPRPTRLEDGGVCAARQAVPIVVAGAQQLNPFEEWTVAHVPEGGDVVAVCEAAVAAPIPRLSRVATDELHRLLTENGHDASGARVDVRRRYDRVVAEVHAPESVNRLTLDFAAARIAQAVRRIDNASPRIDVIVETS